MLFGAGGAIDVKGFGLMSRVRDPVDLSTWPEWCRAPNIILQRALH